MQSKQVVGIVGGGQLGRMLTEAAHKLGFSVTVLDPTPDSPAGQVADKQIIGDFRDPLMVKELGEEVDYVTFEIELADDMALRELEARGVPVNPSPATLAVIKDKYLQKKFLRKGSIPTADFIEVKTRDDAVKAGQDFGYPYVLKAKRDSYDGRGNATVSSEVGIDAAFTKLGNTTIYGTTGKRELYAEKWVPFSKELAVIVARGSQGEITVYPVVETIHKDHILDTVLCPAPIEESEKRKAESFARSVMEHLKGCGVFGIEMFLVGDEVLVNEIAPRVHNSGHHTIEACVTSQFEQHIRAVTGMPLGDTSMKVPAAVMINILGDRTGPAQPKGIVEAEKIPGVKVHIYRKRETKPQRKMGHLTAIADTLDEALANAKSARATISI
jgi:5-(carboxyamino)imidazole ribonucleotide synthase